MKKVLSLAVTMILVLAFFTAASAEVVTKFYGYQWLTYQNKIVGRGIDNEVDKSSFSVPRTYLRWKISDTAYEGNITLDVNNSSGGQGVTATGVAGAIDWAAWLKYASLDLLKIPGLEQIDAQLRIGVQKVYFGTLDTWEYPLIDKEPVDRGSGISSADFGVALVGRIPMGFGSYEVGTFSGSGYKKLDVNATQMFNASLLVTPLPGLYARGSYISTVTSALMATKKYLDAASAVLGYATGPIEGWTEYCSKFDETKSSASASGIFTSLSTFLTFKITNEWALAAMWMQNVPDTKKSKVSRDYRNVYQIGVNYKLAGDAVLVQLDYELDQLVVPQDNSSNNDKIGNLNYITTQVKWAW